MVLPSAKFSLHKKSFIPWLLTAWFKPAIEAAGSAEGRKHDNNDLKHYMHMYVSNGCRLDMEPRGKITLLASCDNGYTIEPLY